MAYSAEIETLERYSSKDYIHFQSRRSNFKMLLDALKDDNIYITVLQGVGGIGKTTLAKEVGRELKQSEQFAHIIYTTVSFTPDTKTIQDDIAGSLGLKLDDCNDSDRPKKLGSRLRNGEKVLLIMDDVWDQDPLLDFEAIGIPKRDNNKGCRILITTRSKQIFNKMECDKMIELDLLSEEEVWTMFKMYAGLTDSFPKDLIIKGCKIAEECKQLPVAIAVIASSLKGQQLHKHEWDVTLKSLKKYGAMDNVDEEMFGVYKCVKTSYDYLKEKAKGLFLLSSLFPEDKEIPIEILTRLHIGTGLLGEAYDNYNDARSKVVVTKNKLIDLCLLEVGEEHVKMHDLVREAAQWIAHNEIRSVNFSNKYEKSSFQRGKNMKYLFFEAKGMDLFSCNYDGSRLEILVVVMQRDEYSECMEVPNSFFENVGMLRVLYISCHDKRPLSLPNSIQFLKNIRSILFDGIDLGNISVLGNLQSLETLDLVKCIIDELPNEIEHLGKFKLLNLEECEIRRNDPFVVIQRCSSLEELYFKDSFNDFCQEITLPELQRYHICKGWSAFDDSLSKYVSFGADDSECFFSKETFSYCMQTTEGLQLKGIKEGWRNLMPEIVSIELGMKDLVELRLSCISQLRCLIDSNNTGSQALNVMFKLVVLELDKMEDLEELFIGSFFFDSMNNLEELSIKHCEKFRRLFSCKLNLCNLKTVTLWDCPMLVDLSLLLTSHNLVLLEKLQIVNCQRLINLIDERREEDSREEIEDGDNYNKSHNSRFPKLKILRIEGCQRLESIFHDLSSQDFPALEAINISKCVRLKFIFGLNQHDELSSLKQIELCELPNFLGIFVRYSCYMSSLVNESSSTSRDGFKAQTKVDPIKPNIFSWICICCQDHRHKPGSMSTTKIPLVHEDSPQNNSTTLVSSSQDRRLILEHTQCFQVQLLNLCNVKIIKLSGILNIKSVFILSTTPRMLVETLSISSCDELKHIIVDIGDDESGGNSWCSVFPKLKTTVDIGDDESGGNNWCSVFPKLKTLSIQNCMQLEYIFGNYNDGHQNHPKTHLPLPTLQSLELINLPSLVAMCPKQYSTTFPSLKIFEIKRCPQVAIKSIDEFIINHSYSKSQDNTIMKKSNSQCLPPREPSQCHPVQSDIMCNLKEITLSDYSKRNFVFILSNTSRMLVETLKIENCHELKQIILDNGGNNWSRVFPKLKKLSIKNCMQLKYIFGRYPDDHPTHDEIHLDLPSLQCLELHSLPSLVAMCSKQYRTTFSSLEKLELVKCSLDNTTIKFLIWKRAQCLPVQSYIMSNIIEMTLSGFPNIKSVFMLSITSRMLVETLKIENCGELKHIIVDIGDDESGGNSCGNVFPKLKTLSIQNCMQLEYIVGYYKDDHPNHSEIHLHLPVLQCLKLCNLPSLVAVCPKQYHTTFSPLKELELMKCSLDNTIMKDLTRSMEHCIALESLVVHNSKAENIFCLNEIERQPMNLEFQMLDLYEEIERQPMILGLKMFELHDLHYTMRLFVGPDNSFSLQNLAQIKIVQCQRLEIAFSTSIFRCLSQLIYLRIENCKELKHIIQDDDDRENQNLSSSTCFPKLKTLVVIKCHKLECVFSVSICKDLPELEAMMISEADKLKEIFKSEGDQKVQIPNLNILVLVNLPSLFQAQEIQFQTGKNRFVQNCRKLSLTSASTPSVMQDISHICSPIKDCEIWQLFQQLEEETKRHDKGNENSSVETPKDVGVGVEAEATLGHKLTSSQIQMKQTLEAEHEFVENASDLETPSVAILPTNSKKLEKEQSTSQQGLINQQDPLGEINATIKTSQEQDVDVRDYLETTEVNDNQDFESPFQQLEDETKGHDSGNKNPNAETINDVVVGVGAEAEATLGHKLASSQIQMKQTLEAEHEFVENASDLETPSVAILPTNSKKLEKEQSTSQQGLINQQDPLGEINATIKTSQGDEEGPALTNTKTITTSSHLKLNLSSQEQEVLEII